MGATKEDPNLWRQQTPGSESWPHSPHPDAINKYLMVSADCHAQEPNDFLSARMPDKYQDRLPGIVLDGSGNKLQKTEGFRPIRLSNLKFEGEDLERAESGKTPEQRIEALDRDGIDCEIIFPNKGLTVWATPDVEFSQAMCRAWNDWAWETFSPHHDRLSPVACIAAGDIEGSIAEVQRSAKRGFRALSLPCKPVWGAPNHEHINYNLPEFDPLWAAVSDVDLPMTFHVSTGRDPRTARGNGGAVINYAVHSLAPTMEPLVNLCASGVIERFPKLRFGSIEAGIGWIPWMLAAMHSSPRTGPGTVTTRVVTVSEWQLLVDAMVVMAPDCQLTELVDTGGATGRFAGGLDRGQQQRNQDPDDRDDDQEFDEGETCVCGTTGLFAIEYHHSTHVRLLVAATWWAGGNRGRRPAIVAVSAASVAFRVGCSAGDQGATGIVLIKGLRAPVEHTHA